MLFITTLHNVTKDIYSFDSFDLITANHGSMYTEISPAYEAFQSAFHARWHAGTLGSCSETEKNKSRK